MSPLKQSTLIDEPGTAVDRPAAPSGDALVLMFERLAANKDVDVEKLEKLIAMQERILAYNAKAEFYRAFADMQSDIPEIEERGSADKWDYARNEDIQKAIKPVLQKHGFMLSFRTEFPTPAVVKVIGILAHRGGHAEQTEFVSAADTSGSKNAIQALGSTQSYGQRYTTKALLNITSRGDDDDGEAVGRNDRQVQRQPPDDKYDVWFQDLETVAQQGLPKLQEMWRQSRSDYRKYLTETDGRTWERLKAKAAKAQAVRS